MFEWCGRAQRKMLAKKIFPQPIKAQIKFQFQSFSMFKTKALQQKCIRHEGKIDKLRSTSWTKSLTLDWWGWFMGDISVVCVSRIRIHLTHSINQSNRVRDEELRYWITTVGPTPAAAVKNGNQRTNWYLTLPVYVLALPFLLAPFLAHPKHTKLSTKTKERQNRKTKKGTAKREIENENRFGLFGFSTPVFVPGAGIVTGFE